MNILHIYESWNTTGTYIIWSFYENVFLVSKSFLEPLGADNDSYRANLLFAQVSKNI